MPIPFDDNLERPEFRCVQAGRVSKPSVFKIYPINQLRLLIETLRVQIPPKHTVLHLVDDAGKIWFAGEAAPDPSVVTEFLIPMHYQMTGRPATSAYCMSAGTMEFSSDYQQIIRMDNKSCAFKPAFDSLKWTLASLIAHTPCLEEQSIRLAAELILEEYSTGVGGFQGIFHTLNTDELTAWVKKTFAKEEASLLQQPADIKTVTYKPSIAANPNSFLVLRSPGLGADVTADLNPAFC